MVKFAAIAVVVRSSSNRGIEACIPLYSLCLPWLPATRDVPESCALIAYLSLGWPVEDHAEPNGSPARGGPPPGFAAVNSGPRRKSATKFKKIV